MVQLKIITILNFYNLTRAPENINRKVERAERKYLVRVGNFKIHLS